jgi:small subunit ribosomal protein S16
MSDSRCLWRIYIGCLAHSLEWPWQTGGRGPKDLTLELEYNMVVIRLARGGAKARPFFNIVVADKRTRRDGRFIERIGFYNPIATEKEESIRVVQDRLTYWRSVGAQASPTVERLIAQAAKKVAA